ncbi:hypothetical protein [Streptomyces sp. NPDC057910]|uniref:hypothetical protein n=1 Tax=Streptomyces sp. NPDC057910 TaxID=3346278 RepID=UPI0036EFAAA2
MTLPNEPDAAPRRAAVYRLYDGEGVLLYIGSAYDPDHRCKGHRKQSWWPKVASRTEEWFEHRGAAYHEELSAIASEGSKHNAMGAPSYRTPDTEAVRERKRLAPVRQRLLDESWSVDVAARKASAAQGRSAAEAERAGMLAAIEFLAATGLFTASVKERRRRLAAEE